MTINLRRVKERTLDLVIITGFTGTLFLTFSLGPIHLFPFRFILLIMWVLLFSNKGKINIKDIKIRGSFKFLLFWVIYALSSLIWADDKVGVVKHSTFLILNISLLFFMVQLLKEPKDFKRIQTIWLFVFVLCIPIGLWEVSTGNHLSTSGLNNVDEGLEYHQFAPTTLFSNQNDYSTYIALTFPFLYVGIRYARNYFGKIMLTCLIGVSILMLMFASSRANYLAVGVGFLSWFILFLNNKNRLTIIATLFGILFLVSINLTSEDMKFLNSVVSDLSALRDSEDSGVDIRSNLIRNGLNFGMKTAGLGVGAGNAEYHMEHYPKYYVGDITNIHNWWIEIFANYGVLIFLGYLIFYINILWMLFKNYRRLKKLEEKRFSEILFCGLVSFPIASLSSSSVIAFNPHWIFFGLALAFINYTKNITQQDAYSYHSI